MKLIITKDYDEMSKIASEQVEKQIREKPDSILGLATGGTPEKMYDLLIKTNKEGLSWKKIKTFNLDEYVGIEPSHDISYHMYMKDKLFDHIDINLENTHVPEGLGDIEKNGEEYDKLIDSSGGIDLQVLGIGQNAHIAFNEPGSSELEGTRRVDLTESTIDANARYFKSREDVPKQAITMGIASILKAKKIILLASGLQKAKAIKDTIEGAVTRDVPSSLLRNHNDVTLIIDEEAASLLSNK